MFLGREKVKTRSRFLLKIIGVVACFLLLPALAPSSVQAANEQVCSFAIDFGDRVVWADVPVEKGMNGFDVFLNATEMLDLSEMHSDTPPYGHTVQRVENYSMQYDFANPKASGKVWHLWYWDSAKDKWSVSNTLLDGIDATKTEAILLIYVQDPYPDPTLPLEHEPTVVENSSEATPSNQSSNESTNESISEPTSETPSGNISLISSNFNYEVHDMNVTFEASSSNESAISTYTWNFGDGSTAEGRKVEHNYTSKGNFTVTLTATNQTGDSMNATQVVRLWSKPSSPETDASNGGEGFPLWGWGLIGLVLIGGAELIYLESRKLKGRR